MGFAILGLIGTALTAFGTYQGMQQRKAQAEYQKAMHEYNAKLEQQRTERQAREGAQRQLEERRRGEKVISKQRSLLAKGGVELTEGSPLLNIAETEAEIEQRARQQSYESRLKRQSSQSRKQMDLLHAGASGRAAGNYNKASYIGTGTSLLSGLSRQQR